MGKVIAKLRVTNEADLLLKRHGALSRQPRRAEVEAVVDPRVIKSRYATSQPRGQSTPPFVIRPS